MRFAVISLPFEVFCRLNAVFTPYLSLSVICVATVIFYCVRVFSLEYFCSQCLMLFNCLAISAFSISCVGSLVVEIFSFFLMLAVFSIIASKIFTKPLKSIGHIASLSSSSEEEDISSAYSSDVPLSSLRFWLGLLFVDIVKI